MAFFCPRRLAWRRGHGTPSAMAAGERERQNRGEARSARYFLCRDHNTLPGSMTLSVLL
jgi:hypothetical protein